MKSLYSRAAGAYKNSQNQSANSRELVAGLLRMLINNIALAKGHYTRREFDEMITYNQKSFHILQILLSCLDVEEGVANEVQALTRHLRRVYGKIFIGLVNIVMSKAPEAEFDRYIAELMTIHQAWQPGRNAAADETPVPSTTAIRPHVAG